MRLLASTDFSHVSDNRVSDNDVLKRRQSLWSWTWHEVWINLEWIISVKQLSPTDTVSVNNHSFKTSGYTPVPVKTDGIICDEFSLKPSIKPSQEMKGSSFTIGSKNYFPFFNKTWFYHQNYLAGWKGDYSILLVKDPRIPWFRGKGLNTGYLGWVLGPLWVQHLGNHSGFGFYLEKHNWPGKGFFQEFLFFP